MIKYLCLLPFIAMSHYFCKIYLYCLLAFVPAALWAQGHDFSSRLSSNAVNAFAQDDKGYVWIGTDHGLNRYNGSDYTVFYASSEDGLLNSDNILSLCNSASGTLWIGTECGLGYFSDGRFWHLHTSVYDPVTRIVNFDDNSILAMGKSGLIKFSRDSVQMTDHFFCNGASWLEHVLVTNDKNVLFTHVVTDSTFLTILSPSLVLQERIYLGDRSLAITGLCERPSGTIYLATNHGLLKFDANAKVPLPLPAKLQNLTDQEQVLFLLPYMQNSLLIGIAGKGIFNYNLQSNMALQPIPNERLTARKYKCFVDRDNNIFLSDGTTDLRFYTNNKQTRTINISEASNKTSHLSIDNEGYLWLREGPNLVCIQPDDGTIVFRDNHHVYSGVTIDYEGKLVAIRDGHTLVWFQPKGGRLTELKTISFDNDLFSINQDEEGNIWASEISSLNRIEAGGNGVIRNIPVDLPFTFIMPAIGTNRIFLVTLDSGIIEVLPDGSFTPIRASADFLGTSTLLVAKDGSLWFGNRNKGLAHYLPETDLLETLDAGAGLIDGNIKSMVEDNDGNIWFSTSTHICKYDVVKETFSSFHDTQFSNGRSYHLVSAAKDKNGLIYFGGSGNITVIDPSIPVPPAKDVPLFIERITVGDNFIDPNIDKLRLKYDQNTLSFRFAGLDFESGSMLNYAYRLEGHEDSWKPLTRISDITYSYLPAGSYSFRARVRDQSGNWSPHEITLPVVIKPAPWASPLAKVFYVALFLFAIFMIIRIRLQKGQLEMAEMRDAMNQQHLDFVTNISHEFRSPLTMIYGPARLLEKSPRINENEKSLVDSILRNADNINKLYGKIMHSADIRDKEALRVAKGDLAALVRFLTDNFRFACMEKGLHLRVQAPEALICFFDEEKIENILSNFLSNAIKYTPGNGSIVVSLHIMPEGKVTLEVQDNGIGIPVEKRSRLFERFDRLDINERDAESIGSGIGLNFSSKLAKIHKGSISYRPYEPSGSIFQLSIPIQADAYTDTEIISHEFVEPANKAEKAIAEPGTKEATVLVVEDNREIALFISEILSDQYNVILSQDGSRAISNLSIGIPDLVLSDIVMPGMDGYELCKQIKESPDWCHIPVVLLTAKADAQSGIHGYDVGADAFLAKPFDPGYLLAVLRSQIQNRKLVQRIVGDLTSSSIESLETSPAVELKDFEKAFLVKLHKYIDDNLDNENLNVEEIAAEMGLSYSSLYSKMKSLTGKSPQVFVSTYRLNIAHDLLKKGELTVSEVAYKVGFSSPFTFSREFKKKFGIPPSKVTSGA